MSNLPVKNSLTEIARLVGNLFISSYEAATNIDMLKSPSVTHVLSLDTVKPCLDSTLEQLFICVSDQPTSDILSLLPAALQFLGDSLQGGGVLVHCRHGVSRSAAVVMAWMLKEEGGSVETVLDKLVMVREQCRPNVAAVVRGYGQ